MPFSVTAGVAGGAAASTWLGGGDSFGASLVASAIGGVEFFTVESLSSGVDLAESGRFALEACSESEQPARAQHENKREKKTSEIQLTFLYDNREINPTLNSLCSFYRAEAFLLAKLERLTVKQAAEVAGVPEGTTAKNQKGTDSRGKCRQALVFDNECRNLGQIF